MTIGTLSGCGKEAGNDEGKTTEVLGNDAEDEMTEVKIWHDGDENIMQTIADCANEKLASGTGYPYNYLLLRSSVINPPLHPH